MVFSKSFGYAVRGLLYIALVNETKPKVQMEEIAVRLASPRYFLGKVMKKLAKEGIINSTKGPHGGFSINESTLQTPLVKLIEITSEADQFDSCVLRTRKCNSKNPCPLHFKVEAMKNQWRSLIADTTVGDLLKYDNPAFLESIATN
jgi:Rrf2 family protein